MNLQVKKGTGETRGPLEQSPEDFPNTHVHSGSRQGERQHYNGKRFCLKACKCERLEWSACSKNWFFTVSEHTLLSMIMLPHLPSKAELLNEEKGFNSANAY